MEKRNWREIHRDDDDFFTKRDAIDYVRSMSAEYPHLRFRIWGRKKRGKIRKTPIYRYRINWKNEDLSDNFNEVKFSLTHNPTPHRNLKTVRDRKQLALKYKYAAKIAAKW